MKKLTRLIKDDMKPALGVTEPGAIAFAVATAKTYVKGDIRHVTLRLNSGIFKNAFTCGIPGSKEVGNFHAAALGAVAADPKKGLECLDGITETEKELAAQMVSDGKISVQLHTISSKIFIEATVETSTEKATVLIKDSHTNIVTITVNEKTVFQKDADVPEESEESPVIHQYTLTDMVTYAKEVPLEEISFIKEAFEMNMALFYEGLENEKTTYARYLFRQNQNQIFSSDEQKTASLLCNAAIEARVIGLDKPAMSITGSGAHGIIATLPLYAVYKVSGYSEEKLLRATALSYLICMYIKEYSGKLSAFCGCAIAAGTGMACGLVFLKDGTIDAMERTINNMASSITGMICDGGNQGCTMKGIVAVDAAFASANMALEGISIDKIHGINGPTPEYTMHYMGKIASPGMTGTEKTIIEILQQKQTI